VSGAGVSATRHITRRLVVGRANAPAEPNCTPQALQTLLGREFRHAVFDAGQGFDAAAFAALSGTLLAGSWLVLLTPPGIPGTRIQTWIHYAGAIALSPFPHRTLLSTSNG
jgi:tRNA(Met) C34 N-acetyltransferase TmcA